jgi:antitoxin VapB
MKKAKLFQNGGSQAVRIPGEYRIEGDEVQIERVGNTLVLRPVGRGSWIEFFEVLEPFPEDFLENREDESPKDRDIF